MPPFCRVKWPQNRVSRGSKCCSCASSICSLPSRVRARCGENVENERRAVEDLAVERLLQIAALRGGKLVVEDDGVHIRLLAVLGELLGLAFADVSGGARRGHLLNPIADDFTPRGSGQFGKLLQRIVQLRDPAGT